jgi:hypothetical protein
MSDLRMRRPGRIWNPELIQKRRDVDGELALTFRHPRAIRPLYAASANATPYRLRELMAYLELSVGGIAVNDARTRESLDISTWRLGQLDPFTTLMARQQAARTANAVGSLSVGTPQCTPPARADSDLPPFRTARSKAFAMLADRHVGDGSVVALTKRPSARPGPGRGSCQPTEDRVGATRRRPSATAAPRAGR